MTEWSKLRHEQKENLLNFARTLKANYTLVVYTVLVLQRLFWKIKRLNIKKQNIKFERRNLNEIATMKGAILITFKLRPMYHLS